MDPISTLGAVASIVQLASAAISLSKSLYTVGSAISSAPEDIKFLAEDLEDFAGSLNIFSRLLGDSESFYSDDIYLCAAKIMRDASNLYVKIQRLVGKLGKGGWKARVRWGFREGEVRKLMGRLRDMKASLMHITLSLHLDLDLTRLGISSGSKLQRGKEVILKPETLQRLEEASRVVNANNILVQNSLAPEFRDKCLEQPIVLSSDSRSRICESEEFIDWEFSSLKISPNQDDSAVEKSILTAKGPLPAKITKHDAAILTEPPKSTARGLMATRSKPGERTSPIHKISSTQNSIIPNPLSPQKEIAGLQEALNRPTGHYETDITGVGNQNYSVANSVIGESSRSLPWGRGVPAVEEGTAQYQALEHKTSLEGPTSPAIPVVDNSFLNTARFMAGETMAGRSRKLASFSTGIRIPPPPPPPNPRIALMALPQPSIEPRSLVFKKASPSLKSLPSIDSFKSALSVQNDDSELKTKLEEIVEDILHAFQTAIDVFKTTVDENAPRSWQFETATNLLKSRLQDGKETINSKYKWFLRADETRYVCDFKDVDINEFKKIPPMLMTGIVVELHMHSIKSDSFREVLFKRLCSVSEDCRAKASFQLEKIQRTSLFPDRDWQEFWAEQSRYHERNTAQSFCAPSPPTAETGRVGVYSLGDPRIDFINRVPGRTLQSAKPVELDKKSENESRPTYRNFPNSPETEPKAARDASMEPRELQGGLINLVSVKKPKRRESYPITSSIPLAPMSFVDHKAPAPDAAFDFGLENTPIGADGSSSKRTSNGLSKRRINTRPKYIPQTPRKPEPEHSVIAHPFPMDSQVTEDATQDSKSETQESPILTPVGEEVFRQLMGIDPLDSLDLGWEIGGGEKETDTEISQHRYDHIELTKGKEIACTSVCRDFEEGKLVQHRSSYRKSPTTAKEARERSRRKAKNRKDDWSKITDPEERRRIQNRMAQRKFRDKAKEAKEREEREYENRKYAAHSYHTPGSDEIGGYDAPSGLPWGSISLKYVVSKWIENRRGEARSLMGQNPYQQPYEVGSSPYSNPYTEESYYDDNCYYENDHSRPAGAYHDSQDFSHFSIIEKLSKAEQQATPNHLETSRLWSKTRIRLQNEFPHIFESLASQVGERARIIFPRKVLHYSGQSLLTLSWEASFKSQKPLQISSNLGEVFEVEEKIITTIFAVDKQIGLEMSSFAWNCIWILLLDYHKTLLLPSPSTALETHLKILFSQLQDIVGVVARYAVMENLYLQNPTLTVRQDYEDEMLAMCIIIVHYFEKSFTSLQKFVANENEGIMSEMAELSQLVVEIKRKDEACQKFTVTIDEVDVGCSESESGIEEFGSSDKDEISVGERSEVSA